MTQRTALALLDRLMSGEAIGECDIDALLNPWTDEDLHLEYKHGNELGKRNAAATVRQYVSAFANSAGGILAVGVDENTHAVVNAVAPGGGELARWASTCLTQVAPYLSPPPRIVTVRHRDGDVLLIAVNRNPALVPLSEAGELAYYLRIHDQTLKAPNYLMTDLVLGRRELAVLEVVNAVAGLSVIGDPTSARHITVTPEITIENRGLLRATRVAAGIVGWTLDDENAPVHRQMFSYLNRVEPPTAWGPHRLRHGRWRLSDSEHTSLPALCLIDLREWQEFKVPWIEHRYKCLMALYIEAENFPLTWYQLECVIPHHSFVLPMQPPSSLGVAIERLSAVRPVVSWDGL